MKTNETRPAAKAATEKGVRMYPRNSLKAPVREFRDTLSAFTVLDQALSPKG